MKNLKTLSIPSILLAVAVLATGCHETDKTTVETDNMGPAQTAGKAVDDAGANAAQATREASRDAAQATREAGADAAQAAREAGAEARVSAHEAGQDIKQGSKEATDATGKALERTGQKMQDASK